MRIIDSWSDKGMKITIFHMSGKYSIKFETQLMEQTYKFRDGQFDNIIEIKELLTDDFYNKITSVFNQMDKHKHDMLNAKEQLDTDFDIII